MILFQRQKILSYVPMKKFEKSKTKEKPLLNLASCTFKEGTTSSTTQPENLYGNKPSSKQ